MPRIERNRTRSRRASAMSRAVAAMKFQPMRARTSAGCVAGIAWLLPQAATATATISPAISFAPCSPAISIPAMVPKRIARNVPASTSALPSSRSSRPSRSGRIAYLSGPKNAASIPITNSSASISAGALEQHRRGGDQHHRDLGGLDDADEPRLVERVGQLARGRRAQEERQDEEAARQRDQDAGRHASRHLRPVGQHQHQRVLQRVVVEGREELRREQRPEPPRADQRQRAAARRLSCIPHPPISHSAASDGQCASFETAASRLPQGEEG